MLIVAVLLGSVSPAFAQTPSQAILWLVDEGTPESEAQVLAGVAEALSAERAGHLLGAEALLERVQEQVRPLPACAFGLEPCGRAEAMAFDALGIGLLVRLDVHRRADVYEISYEMVDRRGSRAKTGRIQAPSLREAGFELVRELFDAVGVVSFESSPTGARVFVDGQELGTTPLSRPFGIGTHEVRMELAAHDAYIESVEVHTGGAHRVQVELEERPGWLRISGAPEAAVILIDDEEQGRAEEMVEIASGHYTLEVRAEGYEPRRQSVQILAEEITDLEVELEEERTLLRDVETQAIADHRFQVALGLDFSAQMASFHGARGQLVEGERYVVEGWLDGGELGEAGPLQTLFLPLGLRASGGWEGRHLGVTFLSFSLTGQSLEQNIRLQVEDGEERVDATVRGIRRLALRPMQVRLRFFYQNLVPFAEAGLGVVFHSMSVEVDGEEPFRMRQAQGLANVELGLRYHLDPRWSVGLSYQFQHHFAEGLGAAHGVGLTLGMGLRDLPGLRDKPPGEL